MPPSLSLRNISLSFGSQPLFEKLTLNLYKGKRVCLVGKNGCGKSTLLKIISGLIDIDTGEMFLQPGVSVGYLPQDAVIPDNTTPVDYVVSLGVDKHKAEEYLDRLEMSQHITTNDLSGGERRRISLAATLALEPDVLLLDEPTNHLDLPTIEWLEKEINGFKGALMVISHDRSFLEKVSNYTFWLDRGTLFENAKGYSDFERWSEEIFAEEARQLDKMDAHLRLEREWLLRGVTARRKRNQGRLRRLHQLRDNRREREVNQHQKMKFMSADGDLSSKLVVEAKDISKTYGVRTLFKDFSTRILRGDRIGIVGPNGSGKSTLIKMLVGKLEPDTGRVKIGAKIDLIYFDQMRETLKHNETLWQNLCPHGGDSVVVQDKSRHVMAYLKDFLFDEKQVRGMVSILSGGEKNRLALAKALAQPSNVLVLDEPTNDLDMDTMDLLIEMLSDYEGTIIVISHDRDFLNKVVTSIIAFETDGSVTEYIGGYDDYLSQRKPLHNRKVEKKASVAANVKAREKQPSTRMTYNQKRLLETLPLEVEKLEAEMNRMENQLAHPSFYTHHREEFIQTTKSLEEVKKKMAQLEEQWLELSIIADV